ncbi:MAG TPA: putative LPS assembly protein LptD, partial [Chitinophagaceae bacterium]|nr:putative LPS assembly protein LptD [Chitinophagaceae bacterium]
MIQLRKFSLKYFSGRIAAVIIFFAVTNKSASLYARSGFFYTPLTQTTDTIPPALLPDSARNQVTGNDTLPGGKRDSMLTRVDTFSLRLSKDTLSAPVNYSAEDSVVVQMINKKIYLYGKTKTQYEDVTLTAPLVEIDQQTQLLKAVHSKDSLGNIVEDASFAQGEQSFTSDTILYNFKTQKGLTTNTITQMEEMFIHGDRMKKISDSVAFIKGGFITTCNLDHPHFGFRTNKLKVINKKLGISGPTHPEFEGVPVPVYIPFGIYPMNQGRRSGLLRAEFATNDQMGVGLEGFGYHHVVNDYWDVSLMGNLYSYGSWSMTVNPNYRKRYKYAGSLNFTLQSTKRNVKGDPDFYSNKSYRLTWNHSADTRSRPGTSFSATVNASTTTFNRDVPNSPMLNFQNQLGSSITYSKTWVDKPYNLTLSANHNQNNQTGIVSVSLPDMGFTVSTLYPFQRKTLAGAKKWYEQLGIGYNGTFRNQVSFYDTAFSLRRLVDTLQWGAQHSIPVTLSLPPILGGAIMVAPSISYSQVWVTR